MSSSTSSTQGSGGSDSGHHIGPYTLTREIGKGSFAVVFQAKLRQSEVTKVGSASSSSRVAIKIVTRRKLTTKLLENLEGEISILRTARHANIVELIDCLKTSSHIYLVMQYCRMGDLSNYIRTRKRGGSSKDGARKADPFEEEAEIQYPNPHDGGLNSEVSRSFLSQLAAALQFMRGKNIVHRDIKPQNLLLQEPEPELVASGHPLLIPQVKVADFGFARHLGEASLAETLCGSPLYMAPEILRYEKYDAKADLWSVGAVLYEMCVGKPPFRAANHVELLKKIEKGEDRIKFPDERSEESLRREQARKAEDGKDIEEMIRPHVVDDDLKALIRSLLKRKPVERMTFESFFTCDVIRDSRKPTVKSMQSSSSSLSNSTTPVATRIAPSIPLSSRQNSSSDLARQGSTAAAASNSNNQDTTIGSTQPIPLQVTSRSYFKPKYVVGGGRANIQPARVSKQEDVLSKTPGQDLSNEAGEASSLEDNVLETPGSSMTHLPVATAAPETSSNTATPSGKGINNARVASRGGQKSVLEEEDKGYVMVEKRNVEVNALADELADTNLVKTANDQRGHWGALVRRPSRLGRLASGLGGVGAAPIPTTTTTTTTGASPPSSYSPSSPTQFTYSSRPPVSPTSVTGSRLATTPPNAPFAIPLGARRPSNQRRSSQNNDGGVSPRFSPSHQQQQQQTALVPSSAPTMIGGSGASPIAYSSPSQPISIATPSSASSSALARAISMASIRLFGVPTGMSLRSASVRRSLRLGLGGGGALLSSSPGNAIDYQSGDPAEQNLLNLLNDYGQKSFVLSEFADSKLSIFYSEGPHQGNYYEGSRQANSSSTSSVNVASLNRLSGVPVQTAVTSSHSSEIVAAEALILYVKSLSFLQRGIDATKDYIEARSSRYAMPYQASVEVNEAVQWLRAKFNDGYERANFARSKASEEIPDSAQNIDKMIFDKALDIAKGAALDEMGSNRTVNDQSWNADKCLLAYETASSLLMVLLDPGDEAMELSDGSVGTIETFVKSIKKRMANLQSRFEVAPTSS